MSRSCQPFARILTGAIATLLSGCAAGPNYHRPDAPVPPQFKEAQGWEPSRPADDIDRGAWWSVFHDATLDRLEQQVAKSNQTVKQYEAAYRQASQVTAAARATLFPTAGVAATTTTSHTPGAQTTTGTSSTGTVATVALEASWVPDLWGKVRRTVESDRALAQADNADLANARLAAQAALAQDYFQARVLDEQAGLYRTQVKQYQEFLTITTNQVRFGTQAQSAVLSAQTQLYAAQAALINVGVQRAAMEHAIAVLMGEAPAQFSLASATLSRDVPQVPISVPSTLLERRPDIAAAERRMASANALIGVATSSYFPTVTLSGEYGTTANNLGSLFGAATNLWSLGTSAVETLLDFGARKAQVRGARAAYDEAVATYRQTVLTGMQGVEDELAAVHIYAQENEVLLKTEKSAHEAVQLDLNEYKQGTVDYTTVITAQATELTASQNVLTVLQERLQANVLLIEDLGGGWSANDLPKN
jgi:NodT family efflux transporter outer membrane factor (OMF) lipoprotein